jgi:hypothetical protein
VTAVTVNSDGWGFAALLIVVTAAVVVIVLGYRILRGESLIHRTRLGVFVERDRYEETEEPVGEDTQELDPGDY